MNRQKADKAQHSCVLFLFCLLLSKSAGQMAAAQGKAAKITDLVASVKANKAWICTMGTDPRHCYFRPVSRQHRCSHSPGGDGQDDGQGGDRLVPLRQVDHGKLKTVLKADKLHADATLVLCTSVLGVDGCEYNVLVYINLNCKFAVAINVHVHCL